MKTSLSQFFCITILIPISISNVNIRPHRLFCITLFWPNSRPRPWHQSMAEKNPIEAKNEIHVAVVVDVVVHVAVVEAHKETSQIYIMTKRRAWEGSKHVRA